jgi:hypothetical protein
MGQVTVTTATDSSSDFQTYGRLHQGNATNPKGQQVGKLTAYAVGAALSADVTGLIVFYNRRPDDASNPVEDIIEATISAPDNQRRTGPDGASGYYTCDIALSRGDAQKLDLLGCTDNVELRFGLPGALPGSTTSLILNLRASSTI